MTQVRSISIGVWLTRGSRHETAERGGIAHFVEHMLFKGTTSRSAEDIAQAIDSIGGQLDAFTAKEYASYYIKGPRRAPASRLRHSLRHRPQPGVQSG
jgi:predicted Zn-dependent peptidase